MMGDRERCIQAQMDEYLSKPLQPNHLIQTIFKCATLGCELLEKNRDRELTWQGESENNKHGSTTTKPNMSGATALPTRPLPPGKATHSFSETDDALTRVCDDTSRARC
jgi:osomolarity two-component system sensor histidine kinase NIK1